MASDVSGTWHGVYCEVDGEIIPPAYVGTIEAKYERGEFSIKVQGKVEHEGTYTIDDKKEPAHITFVYTKSSRFETGKPRVGIFQVTGGTYKNCLGPIGAKAPHTFNTTAKSNTVLTVLQKGEASKAAITPAESSRLLAW
jgi:uncharacterized protein (TIGR03067 family)